MIELVDGGFDVGPVISGSGTNEPFRASLSVHVDSTDIGSGSLSYSFQGMYMSSASITDIEVSEEMELTSTFITNVAANGNQVVISGVANIVPANRGAMMMDHTFVVTIMDGTPDKFSIEINRPDTTLYYSVNMQEVAEGDFDFVIN